MQCWLSAPGSSNKRGYFLNVAVLTSMSRQCANSTKNSQPTKPNDVFLTGLRCPAQGWRTITGMHHTKRFAVGVNRHLDPMQNRAATGLQAR